MGNDIESLAHTKVQFTRDYTCLLYTSSLSGCTSVPFSRSRSEMVQPGATWFTVMP